MNWSSIAEKVGKYAPLLGGLLGGPAGGAVGTIISAALGTENSPDAVDAMLTANPDAVVKLRDIERQRQVELQTLSVTAEGNRLASETAAIVAVNTTMQTEAKAEHWPSYTWRPYNGFIFGTMFIGVYFILPLLHIPVPVVPTEAWLAMGAVLGVASWFRGKAQADPTNPAPVKG